MRKLALSMPDAEERSHFDQPDFRVRNKIFAGLSRDELRATLKLPPELQAALVEDKPEAFVPAAGAWGRSGWTLRRVRPGTACRREGARRGSLATHCAKEPRGCAGQHASDPSPTCSQESRTQHATTSQIKLRASENFGVVGRALTLGARLLGLGPLANITRKAAPHASSDSRTTFFPRGWSSPDSPRTFRVRQL